MATDPSQQVAKAAAALREGRFTAALKLARQGLKAHPRQGAFATLAGLASAQTGDARGAAAYFVTAVRADPGSLDAARNLVQALVHAQEPAKALEAAASAREKWPGDDGLRYLQITAHHARGDAAATLEAADRALAEAPEAANILTLRGRARERLGDGAGAEADFRAALALAPQDPEARRHLAQLLAYHARGAEALAEVETGLAADPDHAGLILQKAGLMQAQGRAAEAAALYDSVLARQPEHPFALNGLAFVTDPAQAEPLMTRLRKAAQAGGTGRDIKVLLGFARAVLARRADDPQAARLLVEANAAAARAMPHDAQAEAATQEALMAPFLAGTARGGPEGATPAPVFIVGLMRSGTTLAEQVLARHPAVAGLGELTRARVLAEAQARAFAQEGSVFDGAGFARDYLAALPPQTKGITHVVDKMPDNFRVTGALLTAFPKAALIEMVRDPRDVALSMWDHLFPTTALAYANDFRAMAAHMNLYARTMARWRELYPGRIEQVAYADLVRDLEGTSRRMASLIGLEWDPAMRHPDRSEAVVMTASAAQLRQPVHDRSVDRWRGQEDLLAPLIEALDPELWPMIAKG
jgi:tetratricopeptide (TPR) repeat protein